MVFQGLDFDSRSLPPLPLGRSRAEVYRDSAGPAQRVLLFAKLMGLSAMVEGSEAFATAAAF